MRSCDGCTLCCRLEKIPDFKRKNVLCEHCKVGEGCGIYETRPSVCREWECLWRTDLTLGDELRPDRVHLYAIAKRDLHVVSVDPHWPEAWRKDGGAEMVDRLADRGHVVVQVGDQINFVNGRGTSRPETLLLEWHL